MHARSAKDVFVLKPGIATAGRLMFTLIFFLSGITHFTATDPEMQTFQISFFLESIAMTGTALLITQLGVKRPDPAGSDQLDRVGASMGKLIKLVLPTAGSTSVGSP